MNYQKNKCFWKAVLIFVLTSFLVQISTGCLATAQKITSNTNEIVRDRADHLSGSDIIEVNFYDAADSNLQDLIKEISLKSGLKSLVKISNPEEFEFRIWTNLGGLGDPTVLGVRSSRKGNNAYYLHMNRGTYSIKSRNEQLTVPKLDWNKMLFDLRSRLTTPHGLVRDCQFQLGRDEPVILLEVLDKGTYRRIFYGQNTTFQDGKRLIEVCDYLASEFDVPMKCQR